MSTPMTPTSLRARAAVLGQLWVVNIALACVIASAYLAHAPGARSISMAAYLYLGLLSCAATLSLAPGLVLLLLSIPLRGRVLRMGAAIVWTAGQLALFFDTQIYGLFRYHFNGMVWNVLTTPGADEALHISAGEYSVVGVGVVLLLLAEYWVFGVLSRQEVRRRGRGLRLSWFLRPAFVWGAVLIPATAIVAGSYAYADLVRDRRVTSLGRLYPVVPTLTVKRFAEKRFGLVLEDRPKFEASLEGILLDYPKTPLPVATDGPRPNIVIIVIDSLRADALDPEVMPWTTAFAPRARVFRDHLSGGNGTRFGMFSLIYGLHGTYWHAILEEFRSPVLIDTLLELGYDTTVLTSASMSFPEFRSTAFVRVEDTVRDRLPEGRPGGRDDGVADYFESWLAEREVGAPPFFALLLLDAPHQSYDFPAEHAVFEPWAKHISYLKMAKGGTPEEILPVKNRYLNAVHYADATTKRILDSIESRGLLEDSLVVITGDHGQEFYENGFFGHTGNATREQIQVPLLLAGPGVPPGEEFGPTSHIDLPVTLLELLGADPTARADWALGDNLLDPDPERRRVMADWDTAVIYTPHGLLRVPLITYRGSQIEVYDERWQLVDDDAAALRAEGPALGQLALELRQFLR